MSAADTSFSDLWADFFKPSRARTLNKKILLLCFRDLFWEEIFETRAMFVFKHMEDELVVIIIISRFGVGKGVKGNFFANVDLESSYVLQFFASYAV